MSVLVVDPSKEYREAAFNLVKWADRRHSVELAEDGASGWKTALEWRPELVFCEPTLPDIGGERLCRQLRSRLPRTTFIAYTNDKRLIQPELANIFDGFLSKPPSRFAVLSHLRAAKRPRRKTESAAKDSSVPPLEDDQRGRHPEPELFRPVHIFVSLVQEKDLRFRIPVPEGSTVGAVFRQIGKANITWFTLIRNSHETDAALHTHIKEGDVLLLKA